MDKMSNDGKLQNKKKLRQIRFGRLKNNNKM